MKGIVLWCPKFEPPQYAGLVANMAGMWFASDPELLTNRYALVMGCDPGSPIYSAIRESYETPFTRWKWLEPLTVLFVSDSEWEEEDRARAADQFVSVFRKVTRKEFTWVGVPVEEELTLPVNDLISQWKEKVVAE